MKTGFSGSVTSHWRRVKRRPSFSLRAPREVCWRTALSLFNPESRTPARGFSLEVRSHPKKTTKLHCTCLIEPARLVFTFVPRLSRLETTMDAALSKLAKKDVPYAKMIPVQKDSDKSEFVEAHDERWVTSLKSCHTVFCWLVPRLVCGYALPQFAGVHSRSGVVGRSLCSFFMIK